VTTNLNPQCDRCLHHWNVHEHGGRFACLAADANGLCPCRGYVHLEITDPIGRSNDKDANA